jgi:hypothetical protein
VRRGPSGRRLVRVAPVSAAVGRVGVGLDGRRLLQRRGHDLGGIVFADFLGLLVHGLRLGRGRPVGVGDVSGWRSLAGRQHDGLLAVLVGRHGHMAHGSPAWEVNEGRPAVTDVCLAAAKDEESEVEDADGLMLVTCMLLLLALTPAPDHHRAPTRF